VPQGRQAATAARRDVARGKTDQGSVVSGAVTSGFHRSVDKLPAQEEYSNIALNM
jgi:hypothetical protein